jgi:hypothetical protein
MRPDKMIALAALGLSLGLAVPVAAQPDPAPNAAGQPADQAAARPAEASIAFVDHGGVRDWQAQGDDKLYIQSSNGKWYLATLAMSAPELPYATAIGFETKGIDRLDRFGAVVVAGTRYPLSSLVESGPPPKAGKAG